MNHNEIIAELLKYVRSTSAVAKSMKTIPQDQSLYEIGVLDSFGVVEMVSFVEERWSIKILDSEITKEKFGGIDKMAFLVAEKLKELKQKAS